MADRCKGRSVGEADSSMERTRAPYETWSYYEDDVILQLLAEEAQKGRRLGNGDWGKDTWPRILKSFMEKTGKARTRDNVLNRMRTWKRQYQRIIALLSKRGFSWDSVAKKLVVEENAWKEYVAKHKDADTFKYQVCRNYELLQVVVGESLATGSCTLTAGNHEEAKSENLASSKVLLLSSEAAEDPVGFGSIVETLEHGVGVQGSGYVGRKRRGYDETGSEESWMNGTRPDNGSKHQDQELGAEASGMEEMSTGSKHGHFKTPSSSRRKHRTQDIGERDRAIFSLISELSTAISSLAGDRAEASCWYEALMEVPALDKMLKYRAPELLDTDEKKVAFCKTPPEERKEYLEFLWEQKCQQRLG